MAPDSSSASAETTRSLLRAAGKAGAGMELAALLVQMNELAIQSMAEAREARAAIALGQRAHADLLTLLSIVDSYGVTEHLQPSDRAQIASIAMRWTEGG
jgi:hypothetical protein